MLAKPFNRSVAESLLSPTGTNNYWLIDDRGIWPKAEWNPALGTGSRINFEFDSWRPAVMFANDSLPQAPGDLPALPFPFDAKDLASFMLYGFGALVADHYGDWENGPNPERIDDLNPLDFSRRAVKEAFEAYREAQRIVDPYPLELDAKADSERKAWNDADSDTDKETKAERGLEMEATAAEAKAAQGKWLKDMVRELIQSAPAKTTTKAAPPVVASDCNALSVFGHSTKTRRNGLTPVIEQAQRACKDPTDTAEVWATLQVLAEKRTPPLIGATEDGLQYLKNGSAASFTRDALRKRLAR
jgi:hypothetical protein